MSFAYALRRHTDPFRCFVQRQPLQVMQLHHLRIDVRHGIHDVVCINGRRRRLLFVRQRLSHHLDLIPVDVLHHVRPQQPLLPTHLTSK